MNEIIVAWDKAALEIVVEEVEFFHRLAMMYIGFVEHQQEMLNEWQEHIWEIL